MRVTGRKWMEEELKSHVLMFKLKNDGGKYEDGLILIII